MDKCDDKVNLIFTNPHIEVPLLRNQVIVSIYLGIEEYLHEINPDLVLQHFPFQNTKHCITFGLEEIDKKKKAEFVKVIWIYIQERFIKI